MGGKGRGKDGMSREVRISKALTQILRHKAENLGLAVRPDGFVPLEQVLACKMVSKLNATVDDVELVTRTSDKQRFELGIEVDGARVIRAVQGHSMKVVQEKELMRELAADDEDLPQDCVHGTYRRHLTDILREGLKAGGKFGIAHRNHVHFAPYAPGDKRVISGMRWDSEVAIFVDLREALRAGIKFFVSKNQVILSPGLLGGIVPSRYFEKVVDLSTKAIVWPTALAAEAAAAAATMSAAASPSSSSTSVAWGPAAASCVASAEVGAAAASFAASPCGYVDELTAALRCYRRRGDVVESAAAAGQAPDRGAICSSEVLRIHSPAAHGSPATEILARLEWRRGRPPGDSGPHRCAVLYLHGFPDQSLDHREEEAAFFGKLSSRFPRKLAEVVLDDVPDALFVAFNFSGVPGSDRGCPFFDKTVSREVCDARAVIRFLRTSGRLASPEAPVHVVGLSTGAIVAALLRGSEPKMTVTAVAGLLDVKEGLRCDFDGRQLEAFESQGSCLKEFWLPLGSPSNPPSEEAPVGHAVLAPAAARADDARASDEAPAGPSPWVKTHLRLSARYREDFLGLSVASAVSAACDCCVAGAAAGGAVAAAAAPGDACPLLVIHGSKDESVPLACGQALFAAAAEPKRFVLVEGGNHLLSNTKHFRKAARAITDMIKDFT